MALLHASPRTVGEVIELRGPRGGKVFVEAPDGLDLRIPADGGRVQLWLAQAGAWRVQWGEDGEVAVIQVVESDDLPAAEPEEQPPAFTYTLR